MNTDKIKTILDAIDAAALITVGDSPYLHSCAVEQSTGDPANEVVRCNWHDDEGREFAVKFTEAGLDAAKIAGNRIAAVDHGGEPTEICLYDLVPKPVTDKADIDALVRFAEENGISAGDLDATLQDLASGSASTANNEGLRGQIEWLVAHCGGVAEAREAIEEFLEE